MTNQRDKAVEVFDELAELTYFGYDFRCVLREDKEAMEAAKKLVALVNKGSTRRKSLS